MKRRLISSILVLGVGFLCASTSLFAQVLQRQSIGFIGGSTNNVEGVFVQSIAAQPYSLAPVSIDDYYINPGFEQSAVIQTAAVEIEINTLIFPNPANSTLQIEIDQEDVSFQIVDLQGRSMQLGELSSSSVTTIQCETWTSGTYFIMFYKNNQQIQASKFVITHL